MAENQVYLIKSGSNSFVETQNEIEIGISGGRLGVGTTNPQAFFHVTGDTQIDGDLTVKGDLTTVNSTTIQVDDKNIELGVGSTTDAAADGGGITLHAGTNNNKTFNWYNTTAAWTSSENLHLTGGKHFSADELRALDSDGLKLADATTSGVLIKGGKVGIHKAAPVYDLDVDGSGNFTSLYVGGNAVLTGEGSIFGKWEDGATEGEIYYTGGNVGLGTNNPEHKLHVVGDSVVDGNFIVNGTSGNLNVSNFNVSGDSIVLNYRGDTLPSARGGLTVRTNTEDKSFEYVGGASDFWLSSENIQINPGKELQTDKVRAIDGDGLYLHDDAGNGIFVKDGGDVGIKNITPSVALDVSGSAKISANVNVSQDINVGNSLNVGSDVFEINKDGVVGNAPPQNGYVITWSSEGKWKALPGGGGGSSSSEVPLAFSTILGTGSVHQITFDGGPYDNVPSIATDLEILGDGPLIPYYISGLSNAGYSAVFAQDITVENSYKLHTTFGGRDVLWATGVDAGSIYYNDGEVSIGNNLTVGGNLTVNGTTTTVNTETVEIEDHNLVIAANTGYNQLTSEYPGAGGAYAGILWGTGDAGDASPVSLTYQTNKGFAFEGGNVGIGTTNPSVALDVVGDISSSGATKTTSLKINTNSTAWADANADDLIIRGADAGLTISSSTSGSGNIYFGDATTAKKQGKIVYDHSKDFLYLATAGDDAITIAANGNVGIGIHNPDVSLEVNGGVDNSVVFRGRCDSATSHTGSGAGNNGRFNLVAFSSDAGNDYGGGIKIQTRDGVNVFHDRMTIDAAGNVGIGTTNPDAPLHILTSNTTDTLLLESTGDSNLNAPDLILYRNSATPADGDNLGIIKFRGVNDGTVGVNRSNIDYALIQSEIIDASNNAEKGSLSFWTRGVGSVDKRMTIDSVGNVGIGTTSPGAKLDIYTATNTNGLIIREDTDNSITHNFYIDNADNGAVILYADGQLPEIKLNTAGDSYINGGNVGIGTTNPTAKLYVNGSTWTTTSWSSSDDRVKHNEQAIVGALETLGKITPKKYIKTSEMYEADHNFELDADGNPVDADGETVEHSIEAGVIAQQVLAVPELAFMVSPEGVDEDGNVTNPYGLNYNSLFTYAIAAIQEQQSIIEDLKSQNASLESRISALES